MKNEMTLTAIVNALEKPQQDIQGTKLETFSVSPEGSVDELLPEY